MGKPQSIDNTYTKLPNNVLEKLAKSKFNGTQRRILDVVIRFTYGYNQNISSLSDNFIAKATGMHPKLINRELNLLIKMAVISIEYKGDYTNSRRIGININTDKWSGNQLDTTNQIVTTNETVDTGTIQSVENVPTNQLPNKDNISKTDKNNTYTHDQLEILEFWNAKGIVKHEETAAMQKSIKNALKKWGKGLIIQAIDNYAVVLKDESYFYTHIWRLDKFLKQGNGLADFLEQGQQWLNYQNRVVKGNDESIGDNASEPKDSSEYAKLLDGV